MDFVIEARVVGITRDDACARGDERTVDALCFAALHDDVVELGFGETVLFEQILGEIDTDLRGAGQLEGREKCHDYFPPRWM